MLSQESGDSPISELGTGDKQNYEDVNIWMISGLKKRLQDSQQIIRNS